MIPLDPYERLFIFTLIPIHFVSLLIAILFLMIVIVKSERGNIKTWFITLHSLIIIWLIGKIIKTIAPTLTIRWSANVFYYLGIIPLGPSLYIFSRSILGKATKYWKFYFIPSIIFIFAIITNPLHYLFYSKYTFLSDSFGPLFFIHFTVTYIFSILSIINLIHGAIKNKDRKRSAISLFISSLFPLIINLNYIFDLLNPMFDITPIMYNFSIIIMGYAAFNYDFFNFIPGIVSKSLNILPGAIVINNRIYGSDKNDLNSKCKISTYNIGINKELLNIKRYTSIEEIIYNTNKLKSTLIDKDSKYKSLVSEINIRTQKIIQKERIKIAGEVHDILGYSISSIISLLEICRFKRINESKYRDIIKKAIDITNRGCLELTKADTTKHKWKERFLKLTTEVELHNIEVETYISNNLNISDKYYMLFYKVLKESITNCLKYGDASKVQITLSIIRNNILFNIINNGQGCPKIRKGTGLNNIELRVEEFNGHVNFYSDNNVGFHTSISIPYITLEDNYFDEFSEKNTLSKLALKGDELLLPS